MRKWTISSGRTWCSPWRTTLTLPSSATARTSTSSCRCSTRCGSSTPENPSWAGQALDILKKRLKVSLPREEAAAIALHFVNYKAQADTAPDIDYGSLIEQATAIVERELNVTVDRDGFNYYRFVTHMHYMMKRTLDDTMIDSQNRELFESMKKEYPDIYSCAVKVAALIDQKLQKHLSEEEILYLILHINRLCAREDCDR